jgi:hypothetical protein
MENNRITKDYTQHRIVPGNIAQYLTEYGDDDNDNTTLNLLARNLFFISRKLPLPTSILKGSLMMANRMSFWISCQRP